MGGQVRTADQEVAAIAARQHGVITWVQLLKAGLTRRMIERRLEKGTLHRIHRGVYRVGHTAPSKQAHYLAAVLAAGDGALLTGRAAGHLMRLLRGPEPPPEVIAPRERRIQGVVTYRSRTLSARDAWTHQGIPCTTIARTLVSLAESLPEEDLARACHQATVLYRTQPDDVEAVLDRQPNAPGATTLRRILRGDTKTTLSRLEQRFLQLLRANNLALPETNKQHNGRYLDCRSPGRRLTVELDSYRYHATRYAWEEDRRRERSTTPGRRLPPLHLGRRLRPSGATARRAQTSTAHNMTPVFRYRVSVDGDPAETGAMLVRPANPEHFDTWRPVLQRHAGRAVGVECFHEFEDEFLQLVVDRDHVTVPARTPIFPTDDGTANVSPPDARLRAAARLVAAQRRTHKIGTLSSGLDDALSAGAALGRFCAQVAPDPFEDPSKETLQAVVELAVFAWWLSACGINGDARSLEFDHALRLTQAVIAGDPSRLEDEPSWIYSQRALLKAASDVIAAACDPHLDWLSEETPPFEHGETPIERLEAAARTLLTTCLQALALFSPAGPSR